MIDAMMASSVERHDINYEGPSKNANKHLVWIFEVSNLLQHKCYKVLHLGHYWVTYRVRMSRTKSIPGGFAIIGDYCSVPALKQTLRSGGISEGKVVMIKEPRHF
eukprot:1318484-Pleurochrysis_carterae.AAC.1